MAVHNFQRDLAYSLELSADNEFNSFYKRVFPGLSDIKFVEDLEEQRKGIDKKLIFDTGKVVTIDEKKRRKDYGDILLELISNTKTMKEGWLLTCQCDYIVYYIEPSKVAYLLPVLFLKMAWQHNKSEWIRRYKTFEASNLYYKSKSIAIPAKVLMDSISREMQHNY